MSHIVREVGVACHEELAMGAVASGGVVVRNDKVLRALAIPDDLFRHAAERQQQEVDRRELADFVRVLEPDELEGVGWWYEDFRQTSDEEVRRLLAEAADRRGRAAPPPTPDVGPAADVERSETPAHNA
jgi:predicted phosphoribosyltransferase